MERIGEIGNYYGGLFVQCVDNKYYWIIENHDTDFSDLSEWDEISFELANELLKLKFDNTKS